MLWETAGADGNIVWGTWWFCVSREVEERVAAAGIGRTMVIPSSIPLDRFTSLPRRANNGRLGIIGALSPQKGHAQFLRALASMEEPPEIWIAGEGKLGLSLRELPNDFLILCSLHH